MFERWLIFVLAFFPCTSANIIADRLLCARFRSSANVVNRLHIRALETIELLAVEDPAVRRTLCKMVDDFKIFAFCEVSVSFPSVSVVRVVFSKA